MGIRKRSVCHGRINCRRDGHIIDHVEEEGRKGVEVSYSGGRMGDTEVYHCERKRKDEAEFKKIACVPSPHLARDKIFLSRLCTVLSALIGSVKMIAAVAP